VSGLGIGFIGAGTVAEMHAKAFERGLRGRFSGVFDPSEARAEAFAERLGGKVYPTREALMADPKIDAVLVLSPNHYHVEDALAALQAGKHVLIEKPIAESRADVARLEHAASAAGRLCMPAHNYIYAPSLIRMKRLIAEGRLGELASLWILYNIFHSEEVARRYGGVLREVAVHHAYSLLYLVGRPVSVAAQTSSIGYKELRAENQVMLTCRFEPGTLANLWVSFAASDPTSDPWTVTYKALGSKGGATYTWNDALIEDDGGPAWGITNYVDSFHSELSHFIEIVQNGGEPLSSLRDAADCLAIIEAAEHSVREGGRAVEIDYEGTTDRG
jgi:predicted dehydrogenase